MNKSPFELLSSNKTHSKDKKLVQSRVFDLGAKFVSQLVCTKDNEKIFIMFD